MFTHLQYTTTQLLMYLLYVDAITYYNSVIYIHNVEETKHVYLLKCNVLNTT